MSSFPVNMHTGGGCSGDVGGKRGWVAWKMLIIKARSEEKVAERVRAEKNSLLALGFGFFTGARGKKIPRPDCGQGCHFIDCLVVFLWSKTTEEGVMQKIMAGLLLIGCCGCSGGMYSDLVEVEMRLASPMFGEGQRVPVVYPGKVGVSNDPMVQAFGPSWRSMENDYPAYNFNP